MKTSKQSRREAKLLFRACVKDGMLDESRVREAVKRVIEAKPRGYAGVLAHFHRLVKLDLDRRSATVESAVPLQPELQTKLQADLSKRYGPGLNFTFKPNPSLIAGLRVKVGSDVFDGSVQARLAALEQSF
jgi:F-type H+-transporting ATPase subunit delta